MKLLALDIGKRRTGVAYFDDATGIPLPLETLRHASVDDCLRQITALAKARGVTDLVLGLPYLPDGTEGEQARFVLGVKERLLTEKFTVSVLDERYSTDSPKNAKNGLDYDTDAAAATTILTLFLARRDTAIDK